MTEKEKLSIKELAFITNKNQSTIYRWLSRERNVSLEDAKLLEEVTGLRRLAWLYPDEFHNPYFVNRKTGGKGDDTKER